MATETKTATATEIAVEKTEQVALLKAIRIVEKAKSLDDAITELEKLIK